MRSQDGRSSPDISPTLHIVHNYLPSLYQFEIEYPVIKSVVFNFHTHHSFHLYFHNRIGPNEKLYIHIHYIYIIGISGIGNGSICVPNYQGDQKFAKRRPEGDHFLAEKETKRRPIYDKKETKYAFFF